MKWRKGVFGRVLELFGQYIEKLRSKVRRLSLKELSAVVGKVVIMSKSCVVAMYVIIFQESPFNC